MKKNSFNQLINSKLTNVHFLILWIIFHVGFLIFFGITYFSNKGNIFIDADLFNMFPKSFNEESVRIADEKLTEITGQNVFIIVANDDFQNAKKTAENVYEKLLDDQINGGKNFASISLYQELGNFDEILSSLKKYKYNLLDDDSINLINSSPETFAQNALMTAYSPFTVLPLDNLEEDPFMIQEKIANNYISAVSSSGIAMGIKDGVLATEKDGTWFILIRGILSKEGASLASKDNGVSKIYEVCNSVENYGSRFIYSGTPFNSHESSNSAIKEISTISTVSLVAVILILLFVFSSPVPILCSLGSILISITTAFVATMAIFHKMHILTLVFGTSLIGSCIDYSLHYFTHWAGNKELSSGKEIRKHLFNGLSLAIISSAVCYIILMFAPFNLLKQMSVFSISGLMSSFLTTICIYPFIPLPQNKREVKFLNIIKPVKNKSTKKLVGRIAITAMFVFSLGTIFIFHNRFAIKNNLYKLYTMEGKLLEDRKETVEITKYNPTCWFIIRGNDENDVLVKEENLCKKIDSHSDKKIGYVSTSKFIPSQEHQKKSREAFKKLLNIADLQYEALGFDSSYTENLKKDFESTEGEFLSLTDGSVPSFITNLISTAYLGELNGQFYTVVMPNLVENSDELKSLVKDENDIFFINKMSDMAQDLDKLTNMVLIFFAGAYILMFVILKLFFTWKQSFKIISIPLLIVLMTSAIFTIFNINLEFFSVTGLILVFGLGLDYIIYMIENEKDKTLKTKTLEPFATLLSFITTVISFGALALSSFQPVHLMGLSIFIGLTTAYVCTMFYDRSL